MNNEIMIGDLRFNAYDVEEQTITSEPTGNRLRKYSFKVQFRGPEIQQKLADSIQGTFLFKVISPEEIEIRAQKGMYSWSYVGGAVDNNTIITADVEVEEVDKDLPEDHSPLAVIGNTAIMNWIRTRAISSMLIKRGLFTEEQYIQEIKDIEERDFENLRKWIAYGIPEKAD